MSVLLLVEISIMKGYIAEYIFAFTLDIHTCVEMLTRLEPNVAVVYGYGAVWKVNLK